MPSAIGPGGKRLELVNGQWVDPETGQPYSGGTAAPAPAAAPPTFSGYIPGVPKPEKPEKPEAPPSGYRWTNGPGSSLVAIQGGPADKNNDKTTDPKLKESENTAAFLSTNLVGNVNLLNKALKIAPDQAAPTWSQKGWGLLGQDIKNSMLPEQRQVIEDSQLAILDAALTLGTGAAYTKEQLQNYQQSFFPQIGDQPAALEAKRERLRIAMVAAKLKAGNAAPMIDQAMRQLGFDPNAAVDGSATPLVTTPPPAGGGGQNGGGNGGGDTPPGTSELTDDQKRAAAAFISQHNGKPTTRQVKTFLEHLTGKTVANADDIAAAIAEGKGISGVVTNLTERQRVEQRIRTEDRRGMRESPVTTLVKQGAMLNLSDEAAGVGNAFAGVLTGSDRGFGANYRLGRDTERQRIADARQQLGYAGTGLEIVGGLASANPAGALAAFSPRAATAAAATGGAISGFGYGEGTAGSLTGLAVGAATGAAVQGGANRLVRRMGGGSPELAPDLARASDAMDVRLSRPMVDPEARGRFGALESDPVAQPIIRSGQRQIANQIEERVGERVGGPGAVLDKSAMGRRVQRGAVRLLEETRNTKNAHYTRAQSIFPDRFTPQAAIDSIDSDIAELSANPNGNREIIAFLQGQRDDLARGGGKTIEELRQIRRNLRGQVSLNNLTMTDAERRVNNALRAASADIAAASPRAAASYLRADTYYRARQNVVKDLQASILGTPEKPLDPQEAAKNVRSLMSDQAKGRRFARIMGNLDREERQDVAASIASTLGREGNNAENAFSPAKFLSDTNGMSRSALRTIFGPEGADAVTHLRTLSRAFRDSAKDVNYSRSGSTVLAATKAFFGSILGFAGAGVGGLASGNATGVGVGALAGAALTGTGVARRVISARAMMNPRFARWAADAINSRTPQQAQRAVQRLGVVISREPALAGELQPIYEHLTGRVAQPLAAEPATDDGNNE